MDKKKVTTHVTPAIRRPESRLSEGLPLDCGLRRNDEREQLQKKKTNMRNAIGGGIKNGLRKVGDIFQNTLTGEENIFSYFKTFVDDKGVAAVMPSSRYLVNRTLKAMDLKHAHSIIEYGAAEGVMTHKIISQMPKDGKILSIELNDCFYEKLKTLNDDPRLSLFHGDVRKVDEIAKVHGLAAGSVDVIVSGIPFAFLGSEGRDELLTKTAVLLRPGGRFVAYQITAHLMPILKNYFKSIRTQFEIRNIPPHFIFTAFK
jgi:phospholipid N-methyltransferase